MALTKIPGNLIETGAITAAALDNDAVTTDKVLDANITHAKLHATMDLTGKTVTVATASGSTNTTAAASTAFVQQELTTLIGGAPGTLDTLNELAAAINDDDDYHTTLTTALATKLPLAGGTMTGTLAMGANAITSTGTISSGAITSSGTVTAPTLIAGAYGAGGTAGDGFRINSTDLYGQTDASDKVHLSAVSGNATFAGTISSGAINISGTSSLSTEFKIGNLTWNQSTGTTSGLLHQYRGSDGYSELQINNTSTSGAVALNIRSSSTSVATIANNGNATFAGTISSGAISATGSANSASAAHLPALLASGSYGGGIATRDTQESGWYQQSYGADWHFYHNRTVASDTPASKKVLSFNSTGAATFANTITIGTDPGGDAFNTTSPLMIGSTTNAYINIKAGTGHAGGLLVGDSDDDFVGGFIYSNSTNDLTLYSNNNERMRIDSSGNVGIGTNSPNGNGILTLNTPADNSAQIVFAENDTAKWLIGHRHDGDYFRFYDLANSAERMRIDSSGKVGIGTTSPSTILDVKGAAARIRISDTDTAGTTGIEFVDSGGTKDAEIEVGNSTQYLAFKTATAERMRIDNTGTLRTTSSDGLAPSIGGGCVSIWGRSNSSTVGILRVYKTGDDGSLVDFYRTGNSKVGSISITSTGTQYNTTSDLRLKTDIQSIDSATTKLMAMNPVTHGWKADPEADAVHGFIAQEMMDIVPEAVTGDPEGEEMMSMDYGRITPVIVAALQDALKEIKELKTRINELEGK